MNASGRDPKISDADVRRVGLCLRCTEARAVVSAKGSSFWLCRRAATDARFPKYPQLPVLACTGYQPGHPEA
jgi:hypothetical protein